MAKSVSFLFLHSLVGSFLLHTSMADLIMPEVPSGALGLVRYLLPLTWLIFQASLLASASQAKSLRFLWLATLGTTEFLHYTVFSADNLFSFLVAYEAVLIPLQLLVAQWGSGSSRLRASVLFFMYTYTSSVPILISVLYLASFTLAGLSPQSAVFFVAYASWQEVTALWLSFALSFAVKTPLFPFFIWLLFAHAEAPVEGSMILAGVVLKLATFGVVAVLMNLLWEGTLAAMAFGITASAFTLLIASLSLVQQVDLKAFVALTSVAHIGNGIIGLLSLSEEGISGALLMALAHGFVSPSLFLIAGGALYGTFGTRLVYAYRGAIVLMPALATLLFAHLFANIAVPMSPNWIAELMILAGLAPESLALCFFSALNILLGAVYTLWLSSRTVLGAWSSHLRGTTDLSFADLFLLLLLSGLTLLLGLFAHRSVQLLTAAGWLFL